MVLQKVKAWIILIHIILRVFLYLKDASAEIYGARAANGVIIITTKRGETGKARISCNFNQGFSTSTRLPKFANSWNLAQFQNE